MNFKHLPAALLAFHSIAATAQAQESPESAATPAGVSREDWAGIRAAFDAELYRVKSSGEMFEAFNAKQDWLTSFDGAGFLVKPSEGSWSWGLALQSYGFEGSPMSQVNDSEVRAEDQRLAYTWDRNLEEWYINDQRGLEHGYTVQERPANSGTEGAALTFELNVLGSLEPVLDADQNTVEFVNADGDGVVTYSKLHVFDAEGVAQAAHFAVSGSVLTIVVDESHATYPLTVDPLGSQKFVKASNTGAGDSFGTSVAVWGQLAVVGASGEDSSSSGVDGDETSDARDGAGAAYVFHRRLGTWRQAAYLKASHPDFTDLFGSSVAIYDGTVVVGARQEDSDATGVNGNANSNASPNSGAVYIFETVGGTWMQVAYLKASNTDAWDYFGTSVAIDGDWLAVGATGEASPSTGINGNEILDTTPEAGAVYMFNRLNGAWSQWAYIKASNTEGGDDFGRSLDLSGSRLVVGAPHEDSLSPGVNGMESDNGGQSAGAAYVFEFSGGAWFQDAYLKASFPGAADEFGASVAIWGQSVAVSAPNEDSDSFGIDGDANNDLRADSGAAYVFRTQAGTWSQEAYFKAHNAGSGAHFGTDLALDGNRLVVGGQSDDFFGPNGSQSDFHSFESGSAYLFERLGGAWSQFSYLKADQNGRGDRFGTAIDMSLGRVFVGTPEEDSFATGIGGNTNNNFEIDSGAVYIEDFHPIVRSYCEPSIPNSTGSRALIFGEGTEVIAGNRFYLGAFLLPRDVYGYFISSLGQQNLPMGAGSQGTLCVGGGGFPITYHQGTIGQAPDFGLIVTHLDLTQMNSPTGFRSVLPGETWSFQCWYRDMNPTNTSNYTNAIAVRFE